MDQVLQKAKREYDADSKNEEVRLRYCRAYARAGLPNKKTGKCLTPWCNSSVKTHQLCIHHKRPDYYDALGLPPTLYFPDDWSSFVDIDYDTERDCQEAGCDSICRCQKIVDVKVTLSSGDSIASTLLSSTNQFGPLTHYAISRVAPRILSADSFDVDITRGYYGEELGTVRYYGDTQFRQQMKTLVSLPVDGQIRHALKLEYGELLPDLDGCKFELQEVPFKAIKMQKEHATAASKDPCFERYKQSFLYDGYAHAIAVLLQEEESYRLIDGYHRVGAWREVKKNKPIPAIVAYRPFKSESIS